ncbi:MAG: SRPBCC family protein [Myxococcales bacterium]|nr:SRPBCC family protein [Myxococcales bacterium]MCB9754913.1 SRPBCC family protein [Myxococcales bacterium]
MPVLRLQTLIRAPPPDVFDASLDVGLHQASARGTGERVIAGRREGRLELGETVTWSARHFGLRWSMTVAIVEHERPHRFVDEMVSGPFAAMRHEHRFAPRHGGAATAMEDVFSFRAPLGPLGRIAERLALTRHMRRFLAGRNEHLKRALEG